MLSASLVVIMLLHEGMTHIHSQKKPRLLFGETSTLTVHIYSIYVAHYAHMLGTNDDFFFVTVSPSAQMEDLCQCTWTLKVTFCQYFNILVLKVHWVKISQLSNSFSEKCGAAYSQSNIEMLVFTPLARKLWTGTVWGWLVSLLTSAISATQ